MSKVPRLKRKEQIWDEVDRLTDRGGASRLDIARALGVSKSPYLIDLIRECLATGEIVEIEEVNPNKPNRLLYYIRN